MAEVSYSLPEGLPPATMLIEAARGLAQLPEASEREDAIMTLFKLIDAVIATPEEVKKRRVRKGNEAFHRKVGRHECALQFLRGVGFMDTDDPDIPGADGRGALLSMPVAFISRLTDAHHTLTSAAREVGLAAPPLPASKGFNPYASNFQATDSTRKVSAPQHYKAETESVRDELKKRALEMKEKVESAPPVPLRPTAFWLSAGRRLEEVVRETAASAIEETSGDAAMIASQVGHVKAALAGNQSFESADKKRLAEISRMRVHEVCILRVICPDKSVLQVTFRSGDTGEHVMSQIAPLLSVNVQAASWYLYQSPPMKRLVARETLQKAGFTPGANLYLGFEGAKPSAPFLEDSLQAQLGSAPPERGVNAVAGPSFSGEAMGWGVGQRLGGAPSTGAASAAPPAAAAPQAAAPAIVWPDEQKPAAAPQAPADGGAQPMEQ